MAFTLTFPMQLFADWGVDYLKMDGCFADPLTFDEGYPTVTRALNESGRHIVFSCSWPAYQVWGGMKVMLLNIQPWDSQGKIWAKTLQTGYSLALVEILQKITGSYMNDLRGIVEGFCHRFLASPWTAKIYTILRLRKPTNDGLFLLIIAILVRWNC